MQSTVDTEPLAGLAPTGEQMSIASLLALRVYAADPTAATAPSPMNPPADTAPASAEPRYQGTGLLASSGLLGGISLALTVTRNVLFKKNCPLDGTASAKCTYSLTSDIGLAGAAWAMNVANVGIASGAGVMLGRYHAFKDAQTGRKRPLKAIMGAGGGVLGVGIVGLVSSVALVFVLPKNCLEKELGSSDPRSGDKCLAKSYPAWTMLNWASFSMVSAGAGMLAYGSAYKNSAGRAVQVSVAPQLGRAQVGRPVAIGRLRPPCARRNGTVKSRD